eukprot:scaffold44907_cov64-Phaeocystis_antarctica.AAC.8
MRVSADSRRARPAVPRTCRTSAGKWKISRQRQGIATPRPTNRVVGCMTCLAYAPITINGVAIMKQDPTAKPISLWLISNSCSITIAVTTSRPATSHALSACTARYVTKSFFCAASFCATSSNGSASFRKFARLAWLEGPRTAPSGTGAPSLLHGTKT